MLLNSDETLLSPDGSAPKANKFWLNLTEGHVRMVMIPLFGVLIPNISGLIRNADYTLPELVVSYLYFVLIAGVIWQGNRYWLFRLRYRYSWLGSPVAKAVTLLTSHTLYTISVSVLLMWIWYQFARTLATDWVAILKASGLVTLLVILITQVYETVFLIGQWHYDRKWGEQLRTTLQLYITESHASRAYLPGNPIRERILAKKGLSTFRCA